jgi:hypothetical protein
MERQEIGVAHWPITSSALALHNDGRRSWMKAREFVSTGVQKVMRRFL